MKNVKLIILLISTLIAGFLGVWVVQENALVTSITLLGFPLMELPIGLWVLAFFIAGTVAGVCLCYPTIFILKRKSRKNIKRLERLDAELSAARSQAASE